jgi:hypothetical protein
MTDREEKDLQNDNSTAFPTGADVAGPGTVRQGSGYSGTTSGGVEVGAGHDPSPDDPPTSGYMGSTTDSDEPVEEAVVIDLRDDE